MHLGYWLSGCGDRAVGIDYSELEPSPADATAPPAPPPGFVLVQPQPSAIPEAVSAPPPSTWEWCNRVADTWTAARLASFYDLEFDQVWWALKRLPPEDISLLDLPSGQARVAGWVASALGAPVPEIFKPAIH